MNSIEEKCKVKGVRLTDQRKVIAKVLSESKEILKVFPNENGTIGFYRQNIKLGNEIKIGWNSTDARALDPK